MHRSRINVARNILRYFVTHPAAKDTLEGIATWWLERERVERTVEEVAEGLRLLQARGLIVRRQGGATRAYYQINAANRKAIAEFLQEDDGTPDRSASGASGSAAEAQ